MVVGCSVSWAGNCSIGCAGGCTKRVLCKVFSLASRCIRGNIKKSSKRPHILCEARAPALALIAKKISLREKISSGLVQPDRVKKRGSQRSDFLPIKEDIRKQPKDHTTGIEMNDSFNQPQNPGNRRSRRRKRNFSNQSQGGQHNQGGQNRNRNNRNRGQRRGGVFVGPMDHSYLNQGNGAGGGQGRFRNGLGGGQRTSELEPLPPREDAPTRIFAFVDDLFFLAKIQEIGRKLNVKVEFVKSQEEIDEKVGDAPEEKPSLVIVDLNSNSIKPITIVSKLKSKFKKNTSIVGFLSHVQGDLKVKAQEAGCDVVMPRSAFSQTLPSLLRRHGAQEEPEENFNKA